MKSVKCQSCGFVSISAANCKKCGAPIAFTERKFQPHGVSSMAWRDNDKLVMDLEATLPDRCIVCNASAAGKRFPLTITYNHKLSKAALLIGVASVSYKEVKLPVGLCASHISGRQFNVFVGIGLIIAGLVIALVSMGTFTSAKTISGPLVVMFIGIAISAGGAMLMSHSPIAIEIEDAQERRFWIKGVSADYLASFPKWTSN